MERELKIGDKVRIVYPSSSYAVGTVDIIIKITSYGSYVCKNTGQWGERSSLELIEPKIETVRESLMF